MAKADDLIEEILTLIERRIDTFNGKMPDLQQQTYAVVLDLASELETSNGRIKPSVKNIKTIAKIKAELNKVIFTKEYTDDLDELIATYEQVTKLQNQYFTATVGRFTVPAVLKEVQNLAQESIVDALGEDAIGANFVSPIRDILVKNVTSGGSRAEFIEEARDFILGQDGKDGKLVKYTGQIVTDSLNQYSRNYAQIISDDLGLEWYMYVGSNKENTREFCRELTAASNTCLPYIHKSQLPEIISGKICGKQLPLYNVTGLPYGMMPGTNAANFQTNVGGYRCNHALRAVSSAIVPKSLRAKFEKA
jgi:hypothetical protein